MRNLIQFNVCEKDNLSREEGKGKERQDIFHGRGRGSYLAQEFLLEVHVLLKCRERFDWLVNDVGES